MLGQDLRFFVLVFAKDGRSRWNTPGAASSGHEEARVCLWWGGFREGSLVAMEEGRNSGFQKQTVAPSRFSSTHFVSLFPYVLESFTIQS